MRGLMLFAAFLFSFMQAEAACVPPNQSIQDLVRTYVSEQYSGFPLEHLLLTEASQANASCFWKLSFTSTTNGRRLTVFLSQDQKFITPTLFDLSVNPQLERQAQAEAAVKELAAQRGAFKGPQTAPVTLIEFSDFECPYCKSLSMLLEQQVLPQEEGKVRVLYRQFPLSMHPWAHMAAIASKCVEAQKPMEFWTVHDYLFQNQSGLTAANIKDRLFAWVAAMPALDSTKFQSCFNGQLSSSEVDQEQHLGERVGVHSTPTVFINGRKYEGPRDGPSLRAAIELNGRISSSIKAQPGNKSYSDHKQETKECIAPAASAARKQEIQIPVE